MHAASNLRAALTVACLAVLLLPVAVRAADSASKSAAPGRPPASGKPDHVTEAIRGRVVLLSDALERRYGIKSDPAARDNMVALESSEGSLHPLVLDTRGRAFVVDKRLRDTDMELMVRRYAGSPLVQVVRVYRIKADGKYEVDYWCDICAISMVISKPCDCCQAETRLRQRKVSE